jgi:hypothetical protein
LQNLNPLDECIPSLVQIGAEAVYMFQLLG